MDRFYIVMSILQKPPWMPDATKPHAYYVIAYVQVFIIEFNT